MERSADTLTRSVSMDASYIPDAVGRGIVTRDAAVALERLMEREMVGFEDLFAAQLDSQYEVVCQVMESAAALQGKRLRPRLALLGAAACGRVTPGTRLAAVVVEMVHAATLVHDDVLDNADTRRGAPTPHLTWGNRSTILLGDILVSKAYILAASGDSPYAAQRVGRAGLALCEGELRQQHTSGKWELPVEEYIDILGQKTGELCAASCVLGAWSAGADPSMMSAVEAFGMQLGIAFQIYDDWLDVWGSPALGKPIGNDISNRKPTLPTLSLVQQTSPSNRAGLIDELNAAELTPELRTALDASTASSITLDAARDYAEAACSALAPLPDSAAKQALIGVAQQCVCRNR